MGSLGLWPSERRVLEAGSGMEPLSTTIKQISSMPNGLSSPSGKYLPMHVLGWVWKKSLLPAVSERGPVVGKVVGSPWRNRCSNERVSRVSVGGKGAGYTLKSMLLDAP